MASITSNLDWITGREANHRMSRGASKEKIRYAVVGLGHIAQVAVLPAFRRAANSELLALVSGDPKKLKELGKKYRLEHLYSYDDYGRALANVDAVYLALPNHLHREYAVRAAAAGVHVLCEKPMAVTQEDCHAMIQAARQNRSKLMIAYRLHFEQGNLEAIELANSGKLGTARLFTSEFSQQVADKNIRTMSSSRGGGPLYDMGVYCINAARYLFRSEPIEVSAVAACVACATSVLSYGVGSSSRGLAQNQTPSFTIRQIDCVGGRQGLPIQHLPEKSPAFA